MTFFRSLRASVIFLTRLPAGGFPYTAEEMAWASAHFPLVGAAVGALCAGVLLATLPASPLGAAMLALGAQLLITGAFHEDGLADTSDALGGAYDRDKLFVILKDSRIGTFGAAALVVSLVGRGAFLATLAHRALGPLVVTGALARLGPLLLMVAMPYATPRDAKSRDIARAGAKQGVVALLWTALVAGVGCAFLAVSPLRVGVAAGLSALVTLLAGWRFHVRAGGITGDFLGAAEQLAELACLATFAWAA